MDEVQLLVVVPIITTVVAGIVSWFMVSFFKKNRRRSEMTAIKLDAVIHALEIVLNGDTQKFTNVYTKRKDDLCKEAGL